MTTTAYGIELRMKLSGLTFSALARRAGVREHRLRLGYVLKPDELERIETVLSDAEAKAKEEVTAR